MDDSTKVSNEINLAKIGSHGFKLKEVASDEAHSDTGVSIVDDVTGIVDLGPIYNCCTAQIGKEDQVEDIAHSYTFMIIAA